MQSAVHAHGPQKGAKRRKTVGPESGTKTDVVSRGALVKITPANPDIYCDTAVGLGFAKLDSFKFVTHPPKTCPLDQFSQLIMNMVSEYEGVQYFCMIFLFKDRCPAF